MRATKFGGDPVNYTKHAAEWSQRQDPSAYMIDRIDARSNYEARKVVEGGRTRQIQCISLRTRSMLAFSTARRCWDCSSRRRNRCPFQIKIAICLRAQFTAKRVTSLIPGNRLLPRSRSIGCAQGVTARRCRMYYSLKTSGNPGAPDRANFWRYLQILKAIGARQRPLNAALTGDDPTGGATHFLDPDIVRRRRCGYLQTGRMVRGHELVLRVNSLAITTP